MTANARIPTNLRTLQILEAFAHAGKALTPTELNRGIGLPKQTVHRLCATLVNEGYLTREGSGKLLRPSRRSRLMASGILHASRSHIARHQVLLQVADEVKETVNFVIPDDKGMFYLDRVETDWPFRVQLPIGTHVPFHCTASGKAFLASLPKNQREKMVGTLKLEQRTPNTLDAPEKLLPELKKVAKQGFALDDEEFIEGMVAIAVPIHDDKKRYLASLAFHGPTQRLSIEVAMTKKGILLKAAQALKDVL